MRRLLLLLFCAACGGPEFRDRPAEEWATDLNSDEKGDDAHEALHSGGADAVPVLSAILEKGKPRAQLRAIEIIGRLGPSAEGAVPALTKMLGHERPELRAFAALALGRIGKEDDTALVKLNVRVSDPDPKVRVMAALAVYCITGDTVTAKDALLRELRAADPRTRHMIAEFAPEMREEGLDVLLILLIDDEPVVRAAALGGLAQLGPAAAVARPTVEAMLLEEPEPAVRTAAVKALTAMQGG